MARRRWRSARVSGPASGEVAEASMALAEPGESAPTTETRAPAPAHVSAHARELAVLVDVERKCEAAAAILADRRCNPADAVLVLLPGWNALASVSAEPTPAGIPDVARWAGLMERLRAEHARAPGEGAAGLTPRELKLLTRWLFLAVRRTRSDVLRRSGNRWLAYRWRALATAVLLMGVGISGALATTMWEEEPVDLGWRGAYFRNEKFLGEAVRRVDPEISFFWDFKAPIKGFPENWFSVRWDGCLRAATPGTYTFAIGSDDGSRLFVNGTEVVDNWGGHGMQWREGKAELELGLHHVRVEFQEQVGGAAMLIKVGRPGERPEPLRPGDVVLPAEGTKEPCRAP